MLLAKPTLPQKIDDEVALEGLEGITLSSLWLYLAKSMQQKVELPEFFKAQVWEYLKHNGHKFQFFLLPSARETLPLFDRFATLDSEFGIPISTEKSLLPRHKLALIQDNGAIGSCEFYKERVEIPLQQIRSTSLKDAISNWGNKLAIVASQDLRYKALIPDTVLFPKEIPTQQYAMLEVIGRSRFNGETTFGPASLQDYCKDSNLVFYVKKRLLKMGLIMTREHTELRKGRLASLTLITLPRFFTTHRSVITSVIETVFNLLHEHPSHSLPLTDIRKVFTLGNQKKSFQKITSAIEFRQVFDVKSLPLSAKKQKPSSTNQQNEKESNEPISKRTVIMVSLRHPDMKLADIYALNHEEDENEDADQVKEEEKARLRKLAYVDMPLKDQFLNAIRSYGPEGISQRELAIVLGVPALRVRQIARCLVLKKTVGVYRKNYGRQRTQLYVANEYLTTISNYNEKKEEFKNLKCDDEPKIPDEVHVDYQDNSDFTAQIKEFRYSVKETRELSYQQATRMAIIVRALNAKCLIYVPDLTHIVADEEKRAGITQAVDRKSVSRVLNSLCKEGTIQLYQAIIKCETRGDVRIHHFATHPKIGMDHPVIKRELAKLKNNLFVRVEEIRFRNDLKRQNEKPKEHIQSPIKKETNDETLDNAKKEAIQKMPKFLISRYMHEFLFYIVMELNEFQHPIKITDELLQHWKETEPSLQTKEYMALLGTEDKNIKTYCKDISWRTFIPPLKTYADKPAGWVFLLDAMDRMPLSLFMKIFRLENNLHKNLEDLIKHPIRQHYVISQLPVELSSLINRVYMQRVFLTILKLLNQMGLVQVSDQNLNKKDKLMMWAYLNRKAVVVDTTPSDMGYSKISGDHEYEKLHFDFKTFDDVNNYWMSLQRICVYTKLGFRKNVETERQKVREISFLEHSEFDEAPLKDIGYIPGDGLGAGGLSTQLYAHTFRNWSWALHTNSKPTTAPVRSGRWTSQSAENRAKLLKMRRTARTKPNLPITLVRRMVPTISGVVSKRTSKSGPRDALDREALKNKNTLRVTWSAEEDKVFKISRAVYLYLAPPVLYLQLVVVAKICRDVLRHTLGVRNKTVESCLRRDRFIFKHNRHLPETPLWVHMLRTNDEIEKKYGKNFLTNLKIIYPNREEYCEALAMHFIQIMCFLYKLINNLDITVGPKFCIPDLINDFHRYYTMRMQLKADNKILQYENPKTDAELKVSVVVGLLHSLMCCARDKTLYLPQAFEIFKNFSEEIMSTAFSRIRKNGMAVDHKRRYMRVSHAPTQLAGPSYTLSSKYRFALTFLKIPYQIFDAVFKSFNKSLEKFYGPSTSNTERSYEFKSMHIGHLLLTGEGRAQDYFSINLKVPTNILIEDPDEAIDKGIQSSQESEQTTDGSKENDNVASEKQIHVKIQRSVTSHKISYSPYDIISKLPTRKLHFFCALDYLQKNVEICLNKLSRQDDESNVIIIECPFKCILKNANYLDAIERIVYEKKNVLKQLIDGPSHKLNNPTTFVNSVKVQPTNLLGIVRMLDTIWQEKEENYEQKDIGKKSISFINRTNVDWQKLCQDILDFKDNQEDDFDKNDEYEATLNKDDRLRDAFVVNLPVLKIEPSLNLRVDETMDYNGWSVPQVLFDIESQRKDILDKIESDASWTYTEETISSLLRNQTIFNGMEQNHVKEIHNFILTKKFGVSMPELLLEFPYEGFLQRALHFLIGNSLIKRVGVLVHIFVHQKYLRDWLVQTFHVTRRDYENLKSSKAIEKRKAAENLSESTSKKRAKLDDFLVNNEEIPPNKEIKKEKIDDVEFQTLPKEKNVIVLRPRPWIRLNGSLNRRVLDRWLGSILNECIAYFGISVSILCQHFQYMYPADIHFLLEILSDLKCVCLKYSRVEPSNLLSNYLPATESIIYEIYEPEFTFVNVCNDAILRLTTFIGAKKYNTDFI